LAFKEKAGRGEREHIIPLLMSERREYSGKVAMNRGIVLTAFALSILFPVKALATMAVCTNCGEIHFGAWLPCDNCGLACDEKTNLMHVCLWFSDHHMSVRTLENFGKVIKILHPEFPDFHDPIWAFFRYIADTYPESGIMSTQLFRLPEPLQTKIPSTLRGLKLPVFEIEMGRSH
jgi:hypothetical protein